MHNLYFMRHSLRYNHALVTKESISPLDRIESRWSDFYVPCMQAQNKYAHWQKQINSVYTYSVHPIYLRLCRTDILVTPGTAVKIMDER